MSDQVDSSGKARRRPLRASHLALGLLLLILVGGVVYLAAGSSGARDRSSVFALGHETTDVVYIASRDLPAFHQITQADIIAIPRASVDDLSRPVVDRDFLLTRYTLLPTPQGAAFDRSRLGPKLTVGSLDVAVVSISLTPESKAADRLTRGDRVEVLFPGSTQPVLNALVVDIPSDTDRTLVLGAPVEEMRRIASTTDANALRVVRVQAYVEP